MAPLSTLAVSCFVVYNKDYTKTANNNMHIDDRTAYIVEPMTTWGDLFLPTPDVGYTKFKIN